jgi:hypothetical protein
MKTLKLENREHQEAPTKFYEQNLLTILFETKRFMPSLRDHQYYQEWYLLGSYAVWLL